MSASIPGWPVTPNYNSHRGTRNDSGRSLSSSHSHTSARLGPELQREQQHSLPHPDRDGRACPRTASQLGAAPMPPIRCMGGNPGLLVNPLSTHKAGETSDIACEQPKLLWTQKLWMGVEGIWAHQQACLTHVPGLGSLVSEIHTFIMGSSPPLKVHAKHQRRSDSITSERNLSSDAQ